MEIKLNIDSIEIFKNENCEEKFKRIKEDFNYNNLNEKEEIVFEGFTNRKEALMVCKNNAKMRQVSDR